MIGTSDQPAGVSFTCVFPSSLRTAGAAPNNVPGLRGIRLRPVPDVPWQQNVHQPQLLHRQLQGPEVHVVQRERPAGLSGLLTLTASSSAHFPLH